VLVALLAAGQFAHAQDGQPSKSTLQQMGLSGMSIMSDDDAMAVRGLGFGSGSMGSSSSASVSGNSFATINTPFGSAHSENAYTATGDHKAGGDNLSFAGTSIIVTQSGNGGKGDGYGNKPPKGGDGGYGSGPPMGGDNGGYGGNKPPKGGNGSYGNKPPKSGNGSYGNKPPKGGNGGYTPPPMNGGGGGYGGSKPPKGGNGGYGGMPGGMGGKTTSITFTVFAGGSSHAYAH
jgi:hypothetical protein